MNSKIIIHIVLLFISLVVVSCNGNTSQNNVSNPVDLYRFNPKCDTSDLSMPSAQNIKSCKVDEDNELLTKDNIIIDKKDKVTCYYPQYSRIDLATEKMPNADDTTVVFTCAGAFTGKCLDKFSHRNVAGHHVCGGVFYEGYKCEPNNGVFTWSMAEGWNYYNCSHDDSLVPLKKTANNGGMGYCQSLLFYKGEQMTGCFQPHQKNLYRALCEICGKLCIVDCNTLMEFGAFMNELKSLNVINATYCDMGTGWNYSWYRDNNGEVKELFSTRGKYTTNWLVFYK